MCEKGLAVIREEPEEPYPLLSDDDSLKSEDLEVDRVTRFCT